MMCVCWKRTCLHRSFIVKSQQNRIELVTRPGLSQTRGCLSTADFPPVSRTHSLTKLSRCTFQKLCPLAHPHRNRKHCVWVKAEKIFRVSMRKTRSQIQGQSPRPSTHRLSHRPEPLSDSTLSSVHPCQVWSLSHLLTTVHFFQVITD